MDILALALETLWFSRVKHVFAIQNADPQIVFEHQKATNPKLLAVNYSKTKKGGEAINNSQRHGRSFWCFCFTCNIKGECLECNPVTPCCTAAQNAPFNKEHHLPFTLRITIRPPPADTKLPVIPHSVPVFQLHNGVLITESPSHMKSQTSTVTSHIYLEKWFWQTSAGPCLSSMLFWSLCFKKL